MAAEPSVLERAMARQSAEASEGPSILDRAMSRQSETQFVPGAEAYAAANKPASEPEPERSLGQKAVDGYKDFYQDTGAGLLNMAVSIPETVTDYRSLTRELSPERVIGKGLKGLAGLIGWDSAEQTIGELLDADERVQGAGGSMVKSLNETQTTINDWKTDDLKDDRAQRGKAMADAHGLLGNTEAFLAETWDNPGVLWDDLLQSGAFTLGSAALSKAFLKAGTTVGKAVAGSAGTISTLAAGSASSDTYQALMGMDDEKWKENTAVKELMAEDVPLEEAKDQVAQGLAQNQLVIQSVVGTVLNMGGIGATLERSLLREATEEVYDKAWKGISIGAFKGALGESVVEGIEGGLEQRLRNEAQIEVDDTIDPNQGVASATVLGAGTGAAMGGPAGAMMGARQVRPNATQGEIDDFIGQMPPAPTGPAALGQPNRPQLAGPDGAPVTTDDQRAAAEQAQYEEAASVAQTRAQRAEREATREASAVSKGAGIVTPRPTSGQLSEQRLMRSFLAVPGITEAQARDLAQRAQAAQTNPNAPLESSAGRTDANEEQPRLDLQFPITTGTSINQGASMDEAAYMDSLKRSLGADTDGFLYVLGEAAKVDLDSIFEADATPTRNIDSAFKQKGSQAPLFRDTNAVAAPKDSPPLGQTPPARTAAIASAPTRTDVEQSVVDEVAAPAVPPVPKSFRDKLTPVQNTFAFRAKERSAKSVTTVNLDDFAGVEKFGGQQVSEQYLNNAAKALTDEFGPDVYRIKGDKFAIPDPPVDVEERLNRVDKALKKQTLVGQVRGRNVSASGLGGIAHGTGAKMKDADAQLGIESGMRVANKKRGVDSSAAPGAMSFTTKNGFPVYPRTAPDGSVVYDRNSTPSTPETTTNDQQQQQGKDNEKRQPSETGKSPEVRNRNDPNQRQSKDGRTVRKPKGQAVKTRGDNQRKKSEAGQQPQPDTEVSSRPKASASSAALKLPAALQARIDALVDTSSSESEAFSKLRANFTTEEQKAVLRQGGIASRMRKRRQEQKAQSRSPGEAQLRMATPRKRTKAQAGKVKAAIAKRIARAGKRIGSVATFNDLPDAVATAAAKVRDKTRSPTAVQAIYHEGQIYLIEDQISNAAEVDLLIAHETMHAALRGQHGANLLDTLNSLHETIGGDTGLQRLADKYGIDLTHYRDAFGSDIAFMRNIKLTDELLAHIAESENGKQSGIAKRAIEQIRKMLDQFGIPLKRRPIDTAEQAVLRTVREAQAWYDDKTYPETAAGKLRGDDRGMRATFDLGDASLRLRPRVPSIADFHEWYSDARTEGKLAKKRWKTVMQRYFHREGLLGADTIELVDLKNHSVAAGNEHLRYISGLARKAIVKLDYDKAQQAKLMDDINAFLDGKEVTLPNTVHTHIEAWRNFIDSMSLNVADMLREELDDAAQDIGDEAMDAWQLYAATNGQEGSLPRGKAHAYNLWKKVLQNQGSYMHRFYAANVDPLHKERVMNDEALMTRAIKELREVKMDNLHAHLQRTRGRQYEQWQLHEMTDGLEGEIAPGLQAKLDEFEKDTTDDAIHHSIGAMLTQAIDSRSGIAMAMGKPGSKDLSVLMSRTNPPAIIKELLGEHVDPFVRFSRTAEHMINLLSNHNMLMGMREQLSGSIILDKEGIDAKGREAYKMIGAKGSDAYNPLGGKFVSIDYYDSLMDLSNGLQGAPWYKAWVGVSGAVKGGKTVFNPGSYFPNWFSSGLIALSNLHISPRYMLDAWAIMGSDVFDVGPNKEARKYEHIELTRLGVTGDGAHSQEAKDAIAIKDSGERGFGSAVQWAKNAGRKIGEVYGWGDDFWKIVAFKMEVDAATGRGMNKEVAEQQSARRIRDTYPTYSKVQLAGKELARLPIVGNFVSFTEQMIANSIKRVGYMREDKRVDPGKFKAGVAGLVAATSSLQIMAGISRMMMGIDEDDDAGYRQGMAHYDKYATILYTGFDENGLPTYVNLSRYDPWGFIRQAWNAATINDGRSVNQRALSSVGEFFGPWFEWDIVTGAVLDAARNTRYSNRNIDVYNDQADGWTQFSDASLYVLNQIQPGVTASATRMWKAGNNEASPSGKQYKVIDETLGILGIRKSTLNPYRVANQAGKELSRRLSGAGSILTRTLSDQGTVGDDELTEAFNDMVAARNYVFAEMRIRVNGLRKMGLSDAEIFTQMRDAKATEENINAVLRGRVAPWDMTDRLGQSSLTSALTNYGKKTAGNQEERNRVIAEHRKRRVLIGKLIREQRQPR